MDMKITILTPDILRAAEIMAEALRPVAAEAPAKKSTKKTAKKVEPVVEEVKPEPAVEEIKPEPVVEAPTYTKKQVSLAGGRLIQSDASKMPAVQALLTEFDVRAVVDLPDDKLDAFAEKLIELGAVIE